MKKERPEISERTKERAVPNCVSVLDFAYKYYKPDRFTGRGMATVDAVLLRMHRDVLEFGFTCISRHDNVTGKFVTYIPSAREMKEIEKVWPQRIKAAREEALKQEMLEKQQRRRGRKPGGRNRPPM